MLFRSSTFTKAQAELKDFIKEAESDEAGINLEIGKLESERRVVVDEIGRAKRSIEWIAKGTA